MTKKDKIKESFLTTPRTMPLMQIRSFLISEGFVEVNAGGSHFKIQGKDGHAYIVPSIMEIVFESTKSSS
ncbi:MAG: hypothetical protein DLD55_03075 [candidate division SR1 bacterium]|nr:MAG: hypothetical protein DLD55_03075 [candidate division SR1 bacterium]